MNAGVSGHLTTEERAALAKLKGSILKLLGSRPVRLILYGSKARGDFDPESDLDVAVIISGLTREEKKRILEKVAEVELEHLTPISALVLSAEEFEFLRKRERRIARDIEQEGIPL